MNYTAEQSLQARMDRSEKKWQATQALNHFVKAHTDDANRRLMLGMAILDVVSDHRDLWKHEDNS